MNNCLIPVSLMLLILVDIYVNIRIRKRTILNQLSRHHKYRKTQMFILMLSSIAIFVITTLPIYLYYIIVPRQFLSMDPSTTFIITEILNWIKSLNYNVSFKRRSMSGSTISTIGHTLEFLTYTFYYWKRRPMSRNL